MSREDEVVEALVSMAKSLVAGDDVSDLLNRLTTECAWACSGRRPVSSTNATCGSRSGLAMPDVYAALVQYAPANNLKLGHLARGLAERTVPPDLVLGLLHRPRQPRIVVGQRPLPQERGWTHPR